MQAHTTSQSTAHGGSPTAVSPTSASPTPASPASTSPTPLQPPWPPAERVKAPAAPIGGPAAWLGRDLKASTEWIHVFTPGEIAELEAALAHARSLGDSPIQLRSQDDFPLQAFGATLADLRRTILHGRGFVLFRGLPLDRYSIADAATIYWGIGLYLGYPVSQNAKGHMLGHITDIGATSAAAQRTADGKIRPFINPEVRAYGSRERFFYHVDSADIVGLLCLRPARTGGVSLLSSAVAIHDAMLQRRPDLLEELYQPFYLNRQNEIPAGARPYYRMPIFQYHQGRLLCTYLRQYVENCKKYPELPALTPAQFEAMDLLDELADDPEFRLEMTLERGDIQFINNHDLLHTRTAYEDFDEPQLRRHLLRLWLVSPDGRALTNYFYDSFGAGRRGGIYTPGLVEIAPLAP